MNIWNGWKRIFTLRKSMLIIFKANLKQVMQKKFWIKVLSILKMEYFMFIHRLFRQIETKILYLQITFQFHNFEISCNLWISTEIKQISLGIFNAIIYVYQKLTFS